MSPSSAPRRPLAPVTGKVHGTLRTPATRSSRVDIWLTRHLDQGRCAVHLTDGQEVRRA